MKTAALLIALSGLAIAAPATEKTKDVHPSEDSSADGNFFVVNWKRDEKAESDDQNADSNFFVVNWRRDAPAPEEEEDATADGNFFVINWRKREAWPVTRDVDGSYKNLE